MHKQRIYIDTSVVGGCFDEEFAEWSNLLFDEFITGSRILVIFNIVANELEDAPSYIQEKLFEIPKDNLIKVLNNVESELLANKYIEFKAISEKFYNDALHIALATINNVDILVSWNFKHIVNYNRIIVYNAVNNLFGYKNIEIRAPKEVVYNEKEF